MQKRDNVSFGGIIYGKLRKMFAEKDSAGVIETAYEVMNSEEYKASEEVLRRNVMSERGEGENVDTINNAKRDNADTASNNADIHNTNSNANAAVDSVDNNIIINDNTNDIEQPLSYNDSNIYNNINNPDNNVQDITVPVNKNADKVSDDNIDIENSTEDKTNINNEVNTDKHSINKSDEALSKEGSKGIDTDNKLNNTDNIDDNKNVFYTSKINKASDDNNTNVNSNKVNNLTTDTYNNIINPKAKRFSNRNIADKYMRPLIQEVWPKLTLQEKGSTYKYTQNSDPFNMPLRGYEKDWDNFVGIGKVDLNNMGAEQDIINLESAINKSPALKNDMWLFRGSSLKSLAGLLHIHKNNIKISNIDWLNKHFKSAVIIDDAFMSTGISEDAGFKDEIAYEIYAPNGTKGIYVEPFSAKGHNEYNEIEPSQYGANWDGEYNTGEVHSETEFLLQKGTKFEILEFKQISNKLIVILKIIN